MSSRTQIPRDVEPSRTIVHPHIDHAARRKNFAARLQRRPLDQRRGPRKHGGAPGRECRKTATPFRRSRGKAGNSELGTGNAALGTRIAGRREAENAGLRVARSSALRDVGCENQRSSERRGQRRRGSAARGGRCPNGSFTNFVGGRGKTCSGNWPVDIMAT